MLQKEMILDLELSAHVWKRLSGTALSETDLAAYDESALTSMRRMKHIDEEGIDEVRSTHARRACSHAVPCPIDAPRRAVPRLPRPAPRTCPAHSHPLPPLTATPLHSCAPQEMFGELFFETFETRLSDGSTVELIEDGAANEVTFSSRGRFADLTISARLAEGAIQCDALLAGIASVVPSARLLSLLSGRELERLICGEADVDVAALRAHTSYGATAAAGMPHVRYFWAVLESFTPEQRRLFLKFIWGRNRLPLTDEDWGEQRMRIHTLEKSNPNAYFPVAHTCFFSIELPKYTSRDNCYKKLLWAINSTRTAHDRGCPLRTHWPRR